MLVPVLLYRFDVRKISHKVIYIYTWELLNLLVTGYSVLETTLGRLP